MTTGTNTRLELPLNHGVWNRLQEEATRVGQSAEALVSDVINAWLQQRERQRIASEIAEFAASNAGGPLDLDRELEAASLFVAHEERS